MSDSQFRKLFMYRMVDGKRRRFCFVVDQAMTIHSEEEVEDPKVPVVHAQENPHIRELQNRGVEFEMGPGGQLIATKIPAAEQEVFKFFSVLTPCWFLGCTELRVEYLAEVDAAGGPDCPDCQSGAIIRRFLPRVRDLLQKHHGQLAEKIEIPGLKAEYPDLHRRFDEELMRLGPSCKECDVSNLVQKYSNMADHRRRMKLT